MEFDISHISLFKAHNKSTIDEYLQKNLAFNPSVTWILNTEAEWKMYIWFVCLIIKIQSWFVSKYVFSKPKIEIILTDIIWSRGLNPIWQPVPPNSISLSNSAFCT